jgi:hypothetical protein
MSYYEKAFAALLVTSHAVAFSARVQSTARRRVAVFSSATVPVFTSDLDAEGLNADAGVAIKPSPGKGFGAFATRSFEKEEIVGDYVGEKLTLREKDARYLGREQNWRDRIWLASRRARGVTASGTYIFQVDDDLFVDAEDPVHANWCRYINHHNDPNMRVKSLAYAFGGEPRVWFVATRDIAPGEELSFDYGDEYWVETDTHVVDQ